MIEEIIKNKAVEIYFQPIVSIKTKSLYAFESLTRCNFNGENIPPNVLFDIAEKSNLRIKLDEMTRELSIIKFLDYYRFDNDLILFLNIESELINNFDIKDSEKGFIELINRLKIPFKNFVLEIKEDEIHDMEAMKKFCSIYKKMGFTIALDDFGTGSSNFHRINIIRPDIIKIDKSLFDDVKKNHINREIINAISKMSHNLGIRVLAEGVEDYDSIYIGMKATINLFQGYYFKKPSLEIDEFDKHKIITKIIDVGNKFKEKNLYKINKKREVIKKFEDIANSIVSGIDDIEDAFLNLERKFKSYLDIEAIYLIDAKSSRQIHNTIMSDSRDKIFKPTVHGDEHYLKEYYYITIESKRGVFLSSKYVSYATGNICKTFAKKFEIAGKSYILCLDIVIEGL